MKTMIPFSLFRLGSPRFLSLCGLVLASLLCFGGCATEDDSTVQPLTDQNGQKTAATNAPSHPEVIILREGDVVKISIPSSPNLNETLSIRRDGKISLQLIGEVQAAGDTIDELQDNLIKLYAPQIGSKDVTV